MYLNIYQISKGNRNYIQYTYTDRMILLTVLFIRGLSQKNANILHIFT